MTSTAPPASERLRRLHHDGELVANYPLVRGLLAGLDDAAFGRAGRLLATLDPDAVSAAHDVPVLPVAITGHGTLNALVAPLTAELARHGLLAKPRLSDFDSYVFDLSDPGSALYAHEPVLALCVLDPAVVLDELPVPWGVADVERVLAEKVALLTRLSSRFAGTARGTLVYNTIPLPRPVTAHLVGHRSRAALSAVWREANARLLRLTETHPSTVVLDSEALLGEGIALADPRLSSYAKAHLSPEFLASYAREAAHLARHLTGSTKKALVLDLDGTVWGGVLGDDGIDGIEVADTFRGEAFRAFQRAVRQLASQGVLVAAVSKNDPEPVREVLRDHPRMTLREQDFVRVVANWLPKHENLAALAEDLNLGVDSFVFVDDSPFERGLVRRELPTVAVVDIGADPARHVEDLVRDGWFDVTEVTTEDRARPARYAEDLARKDFLHSFDSLTDYLHELAVSVRVATTSEPEIARVSQLTLRTNQFNLTTQRLNPAEVTALTRDPDAFVVSVHAGDRFGDNGLVGAVLGHREQDTVHLDNFLLSCRVFSRGVEQTTLSALLGHARASGAKQVVASYRRTQKNGKVRDFYPRNGFTTVTDEGGAATFRHDLAEIAPPPGHVRLTLALGRTTA